MFSHQFNQPKVQWLSGNIGYGRQRPSFAFKTCQLWIRKARVLDFFLPSIRPFQKIFFKDYFFTALVDFGYHFRLASSPPRRIFRFPKKLWNKAPCVLLLVSFVEWKISKHVWDLIFLHYNFIRNIFFLMLISNVHWDTLFQKCLWSRLVNSQHVF